jgi:hypothetical protein
VPPVVARPRLRWSHRSSGSVAPPPSRRLAVGINWSCLRAGRSQDERRGRALRHAGEGRAEGCRVRPHRWRNRVVRCPFDAVSASTARSRSRAVVTRRAGYWPSSPSPRKVTVTVPVACVPEGAAVRCAGRFAGVTRRGVLATVLQEPRPRAPPCRGLHAAGREGATIA